MDRERGSESEQGVREQVVREGGREGGREGVSE